MTKARKYMGNDYYEEDMPLKYKKTSGVQTVEITKNTEENKYDLLVDDKATSSFVDNHIQNVYYDGGTKNLVFNQLIDGETKVVSVPLSNLVSETEKENVIMKKLTPSHALIQRPYINIGSTVYTTEKCHPVLCIEPRTTFKDFITDHKYDMYNISDKRPLVEMCTEISINDDYTEATVKFKTFDKNVKINGITINDTKGIFIKLPTLNFKTNLGTNLIYVKIDDLDMTEDGQYTFTIPSSFARLYTDHPHRLIKVYMPYIDCSPHFIVRNTNGTPLGLQSHRLRGQRMIPVKRHQMAFSLDCNRNLVAQRQENAIPDFFYSESQIDGVNKDIHGRPIITIDTITKFIKESNYEVWWYVATHSNGQSSHKPNENANNNSRFNWKRCFNTVRSGGAQGAILTEASQEQGLFDETKHPDFFKHKLTDPRCNQLGTLWQHKKNRYIDFAIFKIKSRNHTKTVCYENGVIFRYYATQVHSPERDPENRPWEVNPVLKMIGTIKYPKLQF